MTIGGTALLETSKTEIPEAVASQQLATISESRSQPCEQQKRSSLLRHWLGLFALNAGQALDADALSVYVALWLEGFADLSNDVLEAAFRKTLETCKFWPVKIADVREHVESALDSCAEDEWQALLDYCHKWVNRDTARDNPPPPLPPDIDHAARVAGGVYYLESCSEHDRIFAKQRFIEDLTRQRKTGDIAGFLPGSELRELLKAAAPRFELPPAAAEYFGKPCARPALPQTKDTRTPREVLQEIARAGPRYPEQSEQDLAAQKARLDRAIREYRVAHGMPAEFTPEQLALAASVGTKPSVRKTPLPDASQPIDSSQLSAAV